MRYALAGIAASLSFACSPSLAMSGNELQESCREDSSFYKKGLCMGFIEGALTGAGMGAILVSGKPLGRACVAPTATYGQIQKVVVKYMNDNPEILHFQAETIVLAAVVRAFPCSP